MTRLLIPTVSFSLPPNDSALHSLSSTLSALAPRYFKAVILPNLKKKNLLVCSLAGFIFEEHHIWSFNQNAKKKNSPLKALHGPSLSKVDIVIRNEKGDVVQMCQLKCCATKRTCIERLTNEKYAGMQRIGSYEVKRFNILDRVKIGEVESDATTFERMIELGNAIKRFMGKRKRKKENNNSVKCHQKKIDEAFSNLVKTRAQTKLKKEKENHKSFHSKNNMKRQLYRKKSNDWSELSRKDQEERKIQMNPQYENEIMDQGMIINSDEDNDSYHKDVNSNSHHFSKHDNESYSFLKLDEFIKENINFFETSLKIEKKEEKMIEKKLNSNGELILILENKLKQEISSQNLKMVQKNILSEKESEINSKISFNINNPKMVEKNYLNENESKINSKLSDNIELKATKTERSNELLSKKESNLKIYERPPFPILSKTKNDNTKEKSEIKDCFIARKEKTMIDEKSIQSKVRAIEKLKKYETPTFD